MCTIKTTSYSNLKNNINSFMINRLLIIPARGNSKRIHNKNIRLFLVGDGIEKDNLKNW